MLHNIVTTRRQLSGWGFGLVSLAIPGVSLAQNPTPVPTPSAPLEFASGHPGNVFATDGGTVTLTIEPGTVVASGRVVLEDEDSRVLGQIPVPAGVSQVDIPLRGQGFYRLEAQITPASGQPLTLDTTAAVLGPSPESSLRQNSPFGLMAVGGNRTLVTAAGANFDRGFTPQLGISQGADGQFHWYKGYSAKVPDGSDADWVSALMSPPSFALGPDAKGQNLYDKVFPPQDTDAYRKAVRFFADSSPWVRFYEGINEPDAGHWQGTDAELVAYHRLLRDEIHAAGHGQKLLGPCFWHVDLVHLDKLVKLGLLDAVDGISIHSYADGPPEGSWIDDIHRLKQYLAAAGHPGFPIYLTEYGWPTGNGDTPSPDQELVQAQYCARGVTLLAAEHLDGAIYFCLYYNGETGKWSIVHKDSTPRPAYAAIGTAYRWLTGCTGGEMLHPTPTSDWLFFGFGKNTRAVAWDTGHGSRIRLPGKLLRLESMAGVPLTTNSEGTVELSGSPVYMEFAGSALAQPEVATSEAIRVIRGNQLAIATGETWILPAPLTSSAGMLKVPATTPPGEYEAIVQQAGHWRIVPVHVAPPWDVSRVQVIWPKGSSTPAVHFAVRAEAGTALLRPSLQLDNLPDEFGSPVLAKAGQETVASILLPDYVPGTPLDGAVVLEGRATSGTESVTHDLHVLPVPCASMSGAQPNWHEVISVGSSFWKSFGLPAGASLRPEDCSAQLQTAYSPAALWLRVDVTDDELVTAKPGAPLWNADSIQVAICPDSAGTNPSGTMGQRVVEYAIGLVEGQAVVQRSNSTIPDLPAGVPEGRVTATVSRTGTVTSYEVSMPWAALGLPQGPPKTGELGLDVAVNDVDNSGPRHGLEITQGIVNTKSPKDFAVLLLQ